MAKTRSGSAADGLSRLEDLRPRFERLKAERIRAESEVERLAKELDDARRLAREEFGTDDEDEIRRMMEAAEAGNAAAVEEFAASVRAVEERIAGLRAEK
jgi:hypothetical protein